MGSQSFQSNATTTPQPNLRHSTSLSNSRVSPKKWCNKNHLPHNHGNNLSPAGSPLHQTEHQDSLDKTQCVDYINCSQQNGTHFGFIPLTPLKVYTGHCTSNKAIHNIVDLHTTVKASNLPNFMGCRIPLQSQLNITNWRKYLVNYWDQQLVDL